MKLEKLLLIFLLLFKSNLLIGQNSILNNSEFVNYGILDINSVSVSNNWKTTKTLTQSKFSNYGSAKFIYDNKELVLNSTPLKWVDGYVKHYSTTGHLTHLYPVGSSTETMFLKTSNEIINNNISVTWISGDPSVTKDPTDINNDLHLVNLVLEPNLKFVSTIGQWDWNVSNYLGLVDVSVKLPINIFINSVNSSNNTNLRLVGWNGTKWTILQNNNLGSTFERILSGKVSSNITAIGIGLIEDFANSGGIEQKINNFSTDLEKNHRIISAFNVYPNPNKLGDVTLNFNSNYIGNGEISIADELGKQVLKEKLFINDFNIKTIDINQLNNGIYFIIIKNNNEQILHKPKKLIIK